MTDTQNRDTLTGTGCDVCDLHGPEIGDTLDGELRSLHRAMHDFGRAYARSVGGFLAALRPVRGE